MPEIRLKYKKSEIEEFIRQMLAMKGLAPNGDMEFIPTIINDVVKDYSIVIECIPGELLNKCPLCESLLHNGVPVVSPIKMSKGISNASNDVDAIMDEIDEIDELNADVDADIDPELGESVDPPSFKNKSNDKGNSSMNSLLAANRRLTTRRELELAQQKQQTGRLSLMPGESTRPPKSKKRK